MKTSINRIKSLSETFAALLEQERRACEETVSSLTESMRKLQSNNADWRLQRLSAQLKKLQERFNLLVEMARQDFFVKIEREVEAFNDQLLDSRLSAVIASLIKVQPYSLNLFCQTLLDRLLEALGATRGFFVSYLPESTEANIIAARNYQTANLSLEEYSFSRTLLQELFSYGEALLIADASRDPIYSKVESIRRLELRSVIVFPLKHDSRTVGALYLENNRLPSAFGKQDLLLIENVTSFALFCLYHARLLPILFEQEHRVFLEPGRASQEIIGQHPKILALIDTIDRIADSSATVLIEGESGTGKELVARALHFHSARRDRPFIAINCAAIPDNLLESELFGYEKGAFTGAVDRYVGRIEQGNGGTIFLDEISELAYPLQAKLLRFLQSNEFQRLGGRETIRVDVRVVAATSRNLQAMIEERKFQEALFYRLNVIPLRIPALRERKEEIPLFVDHFIDKFSAIYGRGSGLEREAYEILKEYPFPGNVRELENLIHRLVALARDNMIRVADLPSEILQLTSQRVSLKKDGLYRILHTPPADLQDLRERRREIKRVLDEQERQLIEQAVREADGNVTEAADRLGMHRTTLHKITRREKNSRR